MIDATHAEYYEADSFWEGEALKDPSNQRRIDATISRPLKKSRGPKHHQSLTSQNGLQAIFQLWARGKAPPKSRPFDLKSTFSTAC